MEIAKHMQKIQKCKKNALSCSLGLLQLFSLGLSKSRQVSRDKKSWRFAGSSPRACQITSIMICLFFHFEQRSVRPSRASVGALYGLYRGRKKVSEVLNLLGIVDGIFEIVDGLLLA